MSEWLCPSCPAGPGCICSSAQGGRVGSSRDTTLRTMGEEKLPPETWQLPTWGRIIVLITLGTPFVILLSLYFLACRSQELSNCSHYYIFPIEYRGSHSMNTYYLNNQNWQPIMWIFVPFYAKNFYHLLGFWLSLKIEQWITESMRVCVCVYMYVSTFSIPCTQMLLLDSLNNIIK